jgi:hypothetical protein
MRLGQQHGVSALAECKRIDAALQDGGGLLVAALFT